MNKPAIAIAALLGLAAAQSAWANPPTQTLTSQRPDHWLWDGAAPMSRV